MWRYNWLHLNSNSTNAKKLTGLSDNQMILLWLTLILWDSCLYPVKSLGSFSGEDDDIMKTFVALLLGVFIRMHRMRQFEFYTIHRGNIENMQELKPWKKKKKALRASPWTEAKAYWRSRCHGELLLTKKQNQGQGMREGPDLWFSIDDRDNTVKGRKGCNAKNWASRSTSKSYTLMLRSFPMLTGICNYL